MSEIREALPPPPPPPQTGPKIKLTGPKIKLTGPKIKLTGPKIKLTGPKIKLTGPKIKLTSPKIKLTGPKIKLTGPKQWRKFRWGGVGGGAIHLSSNCQFVGNFHFIGSSETHELFYKTVIISKFPTN